MTTPKRRIPGTVHMKTYRRVRNHVSADQTVAVFESCRGTRYSGDPRALFRCFIADERFIDHEFIWAFDEGIALALVAKGFEVEGMSSARSTSDPDPRETLDLDFMFGPQALEELKAATLVVHGSKEYLRSYARAGYWVTNGTLPDYLVPRRCQALIQTWEGMPTMHWLADASSADGPHAEQAAVLQAAGRHLRYLISQSGLATERLGSALAMKRNRRREVALEHGLPRNDSLRTATAEDIARTRARLGLPAGKKVMLYHLGCPDREWASLDSGPPARTLDVEALKEGLSNEWVLVVGAGHGAVTESGFALHDGFVSNAAAFSDVADLYAASDLLITDSSDVAVDFAATRRPIAFLFSTSHTVSEWTADLHLEPSEIPGPVFESERDLVEWTQSAFAPNTAPGDAYDSFARRFAPLDDGGAAARVLESIAFSDPCVFPPPNLADRLKANGRRRIRSAKWSLKRKMLAFGAQPSIVRKFAVSAVALRRRANYRGHCRRERLDDKTVMFESFVGRTYSCNPRALYEAMLNDPRFDDYTFVWAFKRPDRYHDLPEMRRAIVVRFGSQEYYSYHARAGFWISNSVVPPHMELREGQVYVQTWHGTPLKRLGCDLTSHFRNQTRLPAEEKHRWYEDEGRRFTYLLSQSPFASERLASAFALDATDASSKIIEVGYPRNDFLSCSSDEDRTHLRERFDIPEGKTVVLYAPTWRDDQHVAGVGYTLDVGIEFERLRAELGDEYLILFRAHFLVADTFQFERHKGFVRDVSHVDDINDLYVVSDMLITDYSSVFFDFSVLRRPILFYMYDYSRYAEELRGLYLDVSELPGPVIREQSELASQIRAAFSAESEWGPTLERFAQRFASLDDGNASDRVLRHVFESRKRGGTS